MQTVPLWMNMPTDWGTNAAQAGSLSSSLSPQWTGCFSALVLSLAGKSVRRSKSQSYSPGLCP